MMMKSLPRIVSGLLAALSPTLFGGGVAQAQPVPVGSDFQVNSYTQESQTEPSVAAAGNGFVVVWTSWESDGTDTDFASVQGQRIGADGTLLGGQFQVNSYTTGAQAEPSVAGSPFGGFVVVWDSLDRFNGSFTDNLRGRLFDANGNPLGPDFEVDTSTAYRDWEPRVARVGNGRFLVVWERIHLVHPPYTGMIHGRLFLADGTASGDVFEISTDTQVRQRSPSVASGPNGDFVVAWTGSDGDIVGIRARRLAADGTPLAEEFQVNTHTTWIQDSVSVGIGAGGHTWLVWHDGYWTNPPTPGSRTVRAQRYRPDGVEIGGELRISLHPTAEVGEPAVTVDAQGNAFFVWQVVDPAAGSGEISIGGQYFSKGSLLPSDLLASAYTTGDQLAPAVAGPLPDGTMLATWYSSSSPGDDNSGSSVIAHLFRGPAPAAIVPALNRVGLLVLGLILAAGAMYRIRSGG